MEGSVMRINSMDATLRQTGSIEPSRVRSGAAPDSVSGVSLQVRAQQKDASFERSKEGSNVQLQTDDKISDTFIQSSIDKVNHTFEIQRRSVRFKIHERTNEVMVKIVDADTEEVLREIPPEKLLDMFANMLELAGLLVDERR
jgi:flagellar protein FlaG